MRAGFALLELAAPPVRAVVEARLRTLRAAKGRTIIGAASQSSEVFLVAEGEVHVLLHANSGREVSVRQLGPGDIFGELAALDGLPRSATVTVATDARLLAMSRADFLLCLESSTAASLWLTRRLGAEVRRLTERVFELSAFNVQTRLHCELLRLARANVREAGAPCIDPAPTHAELANRIGTHREAVTREIRTLVERRILRARRRSLEFLDVAGLESAVGRAVGDAYQAGMA